MRGVVLPFQIEVFSEFVVPFVGFEWHEAGKMEECQFAEVDMPVNVVKVYSYVFHAF